MSDLSLIHTIHSPFIRHRKQRSLSFVTQFFPGSIQIDENIPGRDLSTGQKMHISLGSYPGISLIEMVNMIVLDRARVCGTKVRAIACQQRPQAPERPENRLSHVNGH